jgi:coenzyme F420-0:L-glutamate ligase/coenzyme F420-1:gamma-L-glutamate ligase
VTLVSVADEIASAAQLVMGEAGGVPAAIVRGAHYEPSEEGCGATIRPAELDLFR